MTAVSLDPAPASVDRFDAVFDSQATFRALLRAMSRPGTTVPVPVADPGCPVSEFGTVAGIARTLLDHEVTLAVVSDAAHDDIATRLERYVREVSGARPAAVSVANYVISVGPLADGLLSALHRGVPAYPDESATLIALLPAPVAGAPALRLAGPGVTHGARLRLTGWSARSIEELIAVNAEPPLGIDLILATADRGVTCLPRSASLARDAGA
jgi:alpha-D-ribose 1-methylphosphonate 5-triphosphate synthase subunit PhnH